MPLPGASPRQSLDDSHLVFRRRPADHSGSCFRFTNMDSPSNENITSESIAIRRHNFSASRAGNPDDKAFQASHGPHQASTRRPNKNARGVTSQSQSHIMSNAEREYSVATKRKADGESVPKKTMHEISSGSFFSRSKGLHSNTELMRPAFRTSSVPDSEALGTHKSELLMSRTRCEKIPDCTTFTEKELNKGFNESWRVTKESKVAHDGQLAGTSRTERKFNGGPTLVSPHTKKRVESDVFSPTTRTSSFRTPTVFSDAGSSLKEYIRSKSTFSGLSDIGEPINSTGYRHMQRSMGGHCGEDSSEGSVAFQSSKHNVPAPAFPQKHKQNTMQSPDSNHFQGGSAGQKPHQIQIETQWPQGANDFKQRVLPEFKKDAVSDSNHCSSMKPDHLVTFIEGLVRTCGSLLSICLKRTRLITAAPSELSTRDNFFVEGSFVIKFRSWISFGF